MIEIRLPDDVAEQAKVAGLLSDLSIQQLLEDALRMRAGRAFLSVAQSVQDDRVAPMSMEEIEAEVAAVRAGRRG